MLFNFLPVLKEEMSDDDYKKEHFETREKELDSVKEKVEKPYANIQMYWENPFENKAPNRSVLEAIKMVFKEKGDNKGKEELQKIAGYFNSVANEVLLDEREENIKKQIDEAIKDPSKYKDAPPKTKITESDLKESFKNVDGVVDKDLADK